MLQSSLLEERAEKLLKDANCFRAPIKLDLCTNYLNIDSTEVDMEDGISGFLAVNGKTSQIGYNKHHGKQRQRFTIAHEIGHFLLHAQSEPLFIDKNNRNRFTQIFNRDETSSSGEIMKEKEANSFAAALLMPRKLIQEEFMKINRTTDFNKIIEDLAKKFEVSKQAMSIRVSRLGYFDYDSAYE